MGEDLREQVKSRYARTALAVLGTGEGGEASCCEPTSCCGEPSGSSCGAHEPEVGSADLTGGSYSAACPVFPGARNRLHWFFEDPSQATGTVEERLKLFRRVRNEVRERIEGELLLEEQQQRSEFEAP